MLTTTATLAHAADRDNNRVVGPIFPILVAIAAVAMDAWVYADARGRAQDGDAVIARFGSLEISQPEHWLIGCVLVGVVFWPAYLVARRT